MVRTSHLQQELHFNIKSIILVSNILHGQEHVAEAMVFDIMDNIIKDKGIDDFKSVAMETPDSDPLKYAIDALIGHSETLIELSHASEAYGISHAEFNKLLKAELVKEYPIARLLK